MKTKQITQNITLTEDLAEWIQKKLSAGFNNVSEVVRDALRKQRDAEARDYLNPPPINMAKIYRRQGPGETAWELRRVKRAVKKREAA